jgi:hypothetical protein
MHPITLCSHQQRAPPIVALLAIPFDDSPRTTEKEHPMSEALSTREELTEIATQTGMRTLMRIIEAGKNSSILVLDDDGVFWEITATRRPTATTDEPLHSPLQNR